eukprot:g16704.t1
MGVPRIWALPTALLASMPPCLASAVSFKERVAWVYDVAPKVRIAGSGFDKLDASTLELDFAPNLKKDTDYQLEIKSSTVIVLSLQEGKRWITLEEGGSSTPLYLSSASDGSDILLGKPVQIATILPSPSTTELYFDPPLQEGTTVLIQVKSSTRIAVTKFFRAENPNVWATEPGPLKVVAINTGGGRLALKPEDGGVVVAEVQADLGGHGVSAQSHDRLHIYQSTKSIQIAGEGFFDGILVRFANALRGGGTNFTISNVQPDVMTLDLVEGSTWRKNPDTLPGALVLLAADAGDGWVPQGPTVAKAGRVVATVFEDPGVAASDVEIFRTFTHELEIVGTGFNKVARPVIDFEPPLDSSSVIVDVMNRTMIRLSLAPGASSWTTVENLGPLAIKGMDTGAGFEVFEAPVTVAMIVEDPEVHESGVHVYPAYGQRRYQSSTEPLTIEGDGFRGKPVLSFGAAIRVDENYTVTVVNERELKLHLVEGSKWGKNAGALVLKGIDVGYGYVELAGGKGVKVATVLEDPVVKPAEMHIHIYATHTRRFPVRGSGLMVDLDGVRRRPSIVIDGLSAADYQIQYPRSNGIMVLELLEGKSWATVPAGSTKPLKLMSINTGAGAVAFPGGIEIALVRGDSATNVCEDSCMFANDGQCDEPRRRLLGGHHAGDADGTNDMTYHYVGYDTTYNYYGQTEGDNGHNMHPCEIGTDCTDCGVKFVAEGTCTNTCKHARDGHCDDPRAAGICFSGTDCQDCGPWGDANSNFTETSFSSFDDDDWALLWGDDGKGQEVNAEHKAVNKASEGKSNEEAAGASNAVVGALWGMVVLVGCSVSLGGCMVAYRQFKVGGRGARMRLSSRTAEEVELPMRGGGVEQPLLYRGRVVPQSSVI